MAGEDNHVVPPSRSRRGDGRMTHTGISRRNFSQEKRRNLRRL